MLAFLGNLGPFELILIAVVAVLIFGKDLPQAASKAYLQVRKLRNAVDDLRRDTGIDRELRNLERNVREAEWEARRAVSSAGSLPHAASNTPAAPAASAPPAAAPPASPPPAPQAEPPATPDSSERSSTDAGAS